jgi:hypothetical protein
MVNGMAMAAAFDAGSDFTVKRGTIEATQPSAEKQLYQVFAEVSFSDGDGFRGVVAEPLLAQYLAADRSGTFYFYNAMGRGALLAADIYGIGWRLSDPEIWHDAAKRKIVWLVAIVLVTLALLTIALSVQTWPIWLATFAAGAVAIGHLVSTIRLTRIAAAAERLRQTRSPTKSQNPAQHGTDNGLFDNSGRIAQAHKPI